MKEEISVYFRGAGVAGQDTGPAWMGRGKRPVLRVVAAWEGRSILPGTKRTKYSRQRRLVRGDLPLRTPRRGKRQIRTIPVKSVRAGHWNDTSLRQPPPAASAKDGFGRFTVSAACSADFVCLCRVSPLPSTPWPWYRPVAATPIPPYPATHGRRA